MSTYLIVRALHVLCGALWVGFAVFSAWWLIPMAGDMGADAPRMTQSLQRRGYLAAVPIVAVIAILSGVWLYWRYTGGFSPEGSRTHAAMIFGTGGILAILAFLIGMLVISRSMMRAAALSREAMTSPREQDRPRLLAAAGALRQRAGAAGQVVAVLVVITIVLMSVAHYL